MLNRTRMVGGVAAVLVMTAIVWSGTQYVGRLPILFAFHAAFLAMLLLILPRPRLDGYLFLAGFLFLGFWFKFMIHLVWHYKFAEPTGAFDGSLEIWDRALSAAAAGAAGVALCRGVHLLIYRRRPNIIDAVIYNIPSWYSQRRPWVWAICVTSTLLLYGANYQFAFFQVGVSPRIVLPYKLNVLLSWASFCGASFLFALLLDWELHIRPRKLLLLVITVSMLGVVASISILTRAVTAFLMVAFAVAISVHMPDLRDRFWKTFRWGLPIILAGSFLISLSMVTWLRDNLYTPSTSSVLSASDHGAGVTPESGTHGGPTAPAAFASPTPPGSSTNSPQLICDRGQLVPASRPLPPTGRLAWIDGLAQEILALAADRWIGLEGVLSVASSPQQLGRRLFTRGIFENPAQGVDSIYQSLAHSRYCQDQNFTFLTLAGAIAILFYSGSPIVVFFGMLLVCGSIILIELLILRLCKSRFLSTLMCLYMANAICQMNFPYLWFVFLAENLVAVLAFYAFSMPWRRLQQPDGPLD